MKKLAVLCITALGAALLVLGTAPSAYAYPELTCHVEVTPQQLRAGEKLTVHGTTPVAVDDQNQQIPDDKLVWTFSWNGKTKSTAGKDVTVTFTAPEVDKTTVIPLTARNTNPVRECVQHVDVTVLGPASVAGPQQAGPQQAGPQQGGGDGLPNTGGPMFWLLVAGVVLVLGGGGAVVVGRRRNTQMG